MKKAVNIITFLAFILAPVIYYAGLDPTFLKTALLQTAGVWILALWLLERKTFTWEPVYLYFGWCFITYLLCPWKLGQPGRETILLFAYLGFFLAGKYYMKDKLLMVMVLTSMVITLFVNFSLTGVHFTRDEVGPTFCQPNIYASWLVLLLPLISIIPMRRIWSEIMVWIIFIFGVTALHMVGCRSGMIALLSAILLIATAKHKKLRILLIPILAGVVLAPFYVILTTPGAQWERLSYWRSSIEAIQLKGLAGWGLGSFRIVYQRFQEPFMQLKMHNLYLENAHNFYLQEWLQTGIIGLALFIGTVWFILRKADLKDPIKLGLVAGVFGCLVDANFNIGLQFAVIQAIFWLWLGILSREGVLCEK